MCGNLVYAFYYIPERFQFDSFELDEPEDAGRYAFIRLDFRSLMIM